MHSPGGGTVRYGESATILNRMAMIYINNCSANIIANLALVSHGTGALEIAGSCSNQSLSSLRKVLRDKSTSTSLALIGGCLESLIGITTTPPSG